MQLKVVFFQIPRNCIRKINPAFATQFHESQRSWVQILTSAGLFLFYVSPWCWLEATTAAKIKLRDYKAPKRFLSFDCSLGNIGKQDHFTNQSNRFRTRTQTREVLKTCLFFKKVDHADKRKKNFGDLWPNFFFCQSFKKLSKLPPLFFCGYFEYFFGQRQNDQKM